VQLETNTARAVNGDRARPNETLFKTTHHRIKKSTTCVRVRGGLHVTMETLRFRHHRKLVKSHWPPLTLEGRYRTTNYLSP